MSAARSAPESKPGLHLRQALISVAIQAVLDIQRMRSGDVDASVHALRVRMKKLHALLKLIRPVTSKAARRGIKQDMRILKQAFAVGRDQKVIHALLKEFCSDEVSVPRPSLASSTPGSAVSPARLRVLKRTALSLLGRVRTLKLHRLSWNQIADAFHDNYLKARRKFKRCKEKPAARPLHRWRTPVKDHYYQILCLMRDRRRAAQAHKLGSLLGKYHDLVLFSDHLHQVSPGTRMPVIKREMKNLLPRLFRKAAKLFRLTPRKLKHQMLAVARAKPSS